MIEHRNLEEITEKKIGIITASDHSPIMVKINLQGEASGKGTWRLNEDIIEDRETEKIITEEIQKYFQENDTPELSKATNWGVQKAVIRGKLISRESREKEGKKRKHDENYKGNI